MTRPVVGEWTRLLIDEHFRKCVTFLYAERPTGEGEAARREPVGSAFFVGLPALDDSGTLVGAFRYAVTARHVIDGHDFLWLRIRTKDGDSQSYVDLPVVKDAWATHPSTDVAIAGMGFAASWDVVHVMREHFADQEFSDKHNLHLGEGDEVFFSGLFVGHYGRGVPQPIIRFGNIALMPHEPVTVQISKHPHTLAAIEAYLVEARSWGGQSGSPAFVTFSPDREMGGGLSVGGYPAFALLGLVQGIWTDPQGAKAPDPSGEGVIEVNMGISVVVPAYKILEVLMSDELEQERQDVLDRLKESAGSLAPASATSADESSDEFDQFEDLTRKLVNTPKPSDSAKPKDES